MSTLKLTSNLRAIVDWTEIDDDQGISQQTDLGEAPLDIEFSYGTGDGQINEAWYSDITIPANSSQVIDLLELPFEILNLTINKEINILKALFLENTNSSGNIIVSNSGVDEGVDFLGLSFDIGYSGVYEMTTQMGITITSNKHNINLTNPNSFDVICKALVMGVDN